MTKDKLIVLLKKFLKESGKADYASGDSKNWVKEKNGSTTIFYKSGNWTSHDNFFGGEPYGGRTVVHYNEKPVWMFIYYGRVEPDVTDIKKVYDFLKSALNAELENKIFRGPKSFVKGEFKYANSWEGGLEEFFGEEKIYREEKIIYFAKYMGGLVDQRKDEETA